MSLIGLSLPSICLKTRPCKFSNQVYDEHFPVHCSFYFQFFLILLMYRTVLRNSGCGSVGRAATSETRDLQFKSTHWKTLFALNGIINILYWKDDNKKEVSSSGCGSVGRAVASGTRGPRFRSSHWPFSVSFSFLVFSIQLTLTNKYKRLK